MDPVKKDPEFGKLVKSNDKVGIVHCQVGPGLAGWGSKELTVHAHG